MIKLGSLSFPEDTPRIAVSFGDHASVRVIQDAEKLGLDIVELRVDLCSRYDEKYILDEIKKFKNLPLIGTIRSKKEGGNWGRSDAERLSLFEAMLPTVDAVDIEISSKEILAEVVKAAHAVKKIVIVSHHDFQKTPNIDELSKIAGEARSVGADIVKIATLVLKSEDIQTLAEFTIANKPKGVVSIGMGDKGVVTRILLLALGSLITYAALGQSTAPGQLEFADTVDLIRRLYPKYNEEKILALKLLEAV